MEAHDLFRVIEGSKENRKKACLALSMILNCISESQSHRANIKKSVKENWEVLWPLHVKVDFMVQPKVKVLKREFQTLLMKNNEKVENFV